MGGEDEDEDEEKNAQIFFYCRYFARLYLPHSYALSSCLSLLFHFAVLVSFFLQDFKLSSQLQTEATPFSGSGSAWVHILSRLVMPSPILSRRMFCYMPDVRRYSWHRNIDQAGR